MKETLKKTILYAGVIGSISGLTKCLDILPNPKLMYEERKHIKAGNIKEANKISYLIEYNERSATTGRNLILPSFAVMMVGNYLNNKQEENENTR